jgi:hypothetical protein
MFYSFNSCDPFTSVEIQYQADGNWITCSTVPAETPQVIQGMKQAASIYPKNRIRAVDQDGRLVDNL